MQDPTATHAARDDALRVYWRHAAGDLDFYQVFIRHNNAFLQNRTVPRTQNECVFAGLVPGRLYTVLIRTWSGNYESSAYTHGRTREWALLMTFRPQKNSNMSFMSLLSRSPGRCALPGSDGF